MSEQLTGYRTTPVQPSMKTSRGSSRGYVVDTANVTAKHATAKYQKSGSMAKLIQLFDNKD